MIVSKEAEDKGCILFGRATGFDLTAFGEKGFRMGLRIERGMQTHTVRFTQGGKMTVHEGDRKQPCLTLKADMLDMSRPWWSRDGPVTMTMTGTKAGETYEIKVIDTEAVMTKRPSRGMEGKR